MIVGLTGYARTGKDTVGKILVDHHGFRRVAFGDTLKAIAEDLDAVIELEDDGDAFVDGIGFSTSVSKLLDAYGGWEGVKDACPEARQYLVDLGNSLRRRIPGVEIAASLGNVDPSEDVVNTNVYHPEEVDQIRRMGGLVLRVRRPGFHAANADEEATALRAEVDGVIENTGSLADLEAQVVGLLQQLGAVA